MSRVIKGRLPELSCLLRGHSDGEGCPFDVTFKVVESDEVADEEDKEDEVKAHRIILASFSTVFSAMFYGPMKETRDVIDVKGTTVSAFKTMIEFFYQVDVDCTELGIHELFQIVNLAERYNVDRLKEEMKNQMEILSIPMENLMEAVSMASKFANFEAASSALMLNCAKVFRKKTPRMADQFQFIQEQHLCGRGLLVLELLALVKTLPAEPCENCNEEEICLRGTPVMKEDLREGLKVKLSDADFWNGVGDKRYKIAALLLGDQVRLVEEGNPSFLLDAALMGNSGRLRNGANLCYDCSE